MEREDMPPGTWDALEDAAEMLNASGLAYILTVGQEGSRIARTRTNALNLDGLEWLASRNADNVERLRKDYAE